MSLKDTWQQQRNQRQQAVRERQQTVKASLSTIRQERQNQALQLHHTLSGFRGLLAIDNTARRNELQQFCQTLQAETQAFLTATGSHRHVQATQFAQELALFVQVLRQETSNFLVVAHDEQGAAAHRVKQTMLTFVDALHSDVQSYLLALETMRQEQATQLNQELIQNRAQRDAEAQALFQRLATFRAELRHFSQDLHSVVWGDSAAVSAPAKPTVAAKQAPAPKQTTQPLEPISIVANGIDAKAITTILGDFQRMT